MGRNMFGGRGPWGDQPWNGWWGDDPPFHTPVFVVTHHPREPLVMQGGTTFTFVTDGIESALTQAMRAAGGKDVTLGGGASVIQQYLKAGLLDELQINLVPGPARRRRAAVRQRGWRPLGTGAGRRGPRRHAPRVPPRLAAVVREVLGVLHAAAPAPSPAPPDRRERAHEDASRDRHPRAHTAAVQVRDARGM